MTTVPGFSSRHTDTTIRQFPQRDGAAMTDIAGMEQPGWSNSNSVASETEAKAVTEVDSKVVEADVVEDKAVTKKTTARKSAPKKG